MHEVSIITKEIECFFIMISLRVTEYMYLFIKLLKTNTNVITILLLLLLLLFSTAKKTIIIFN